LEDDVNVVLFSAIIHIANFHLDLVW